MEGPTRRWRAPEGALIGRPDPHVRERRIALGLGAATLASVIAAHRLSWGDGLLGSGAFALTLLGILAVHELGHRIVARRHDLAVSLPLFLPAPFWVGTLGAIIRIHGTPRSRDALLQTGAAGPLAGLVGIVGAFVLRLTVLDDPTGGQALQQPLVWQGLALALRGEPVALTTADPVAFGAWVGCLVTALNLLPFGQLDGGHVAWALIPTRARAAGWATTVVLLGGGLVWWGWPLWALVLHAMGARHPLRVSDTESPPDKTSRWLAAGVAATFVLCFTPVPW